MTTTHTNETVFAAAGIDTAKLEFPDLGIPILTGIQRQGDLILVPIEASVDGEPLGAGIAVVEAESDSANSHILLGDGTWQRVTGDALVEGRLTVPAGGEAFLIHTEEHNALGIGPGNYEIRRQREWDPTAASTGIDARLLAEEQAEEAERLRIRQERLAYRQVRD